MSCELPEDFISELPSRIIAARKAKLQSMLPSGVQASGSSRWWDDNMDHNGHYPHYWGTRWESSVSASWGGVSDSGRKLTITFTINITTTSTGEQYTQCPYCNGELEIPEEWQ